MSGMQMFRADGYAARVVNVTVENGQPVARWVDPEDRPASPT